jgi:hypothetical protein
MELSRHLRPVCPAAVVYHFHNAGTQNIVLPGSISPFVLQSNVDIDPSFFTLTNSTRSFAVIK